MNTSSPYPTGTAFGSVDTLCDVIQLLAVHRVGCMIDCSAGNIRCCTQTHPAPFSLIFPSSAPPPFLPALPTFSLVHRQFFLILPVSLVVPVSLVPPSFSPLYPCFPLFLPVSPRFPPFPPFFLWSMMYPEVHRIWVLLRPAIENNGNMLD